MARTYITGFEYGAQGEFQTDQATYSTTTKRSGTYGAVFTNQAFNQQQIKSSGGTFTSFARSARFYLRVLTLPNITTAIFSTATTAPAQVDRLQLTSTGTLIVTDGTNSATSSNALSVDGLWHRIEFDVGWSSGSGRRVFVDGVEWASTATGASSAQQNMFVGLIDAISSGSIGIDDLVVDNNTFVTSGFPGDGQVTLLLPTSDNTIGTWVGGAGGTTSEFDAINNRPPVGKVLASGTNTTQIKNVSTGTTSDGTYNCQTYTAAGIWGTVNIVMAIVNHGNGSTTSLAGGVWVSSNPTQTAPGTTFAYGGGTVAAGTYPSNWKTQLGPTSVAPAVTLGSSPVVAIRKSTSNVAAAMCDLLGVYVDWTPIPNFYPAFPDYVFENCGIVESGEI